MIHLFDPLAIPSRENFCETRIGRCGQPMSRGSRLRGLFSIYVQRLKGRKPAFR